MLDGVAGVLTISIAAVLMGGLTGVIAASKGHPFWVWAVVGFVLPVLGLVVVMAVLPNRGEPTEGPSAAVVDATRRSAIARALASGGPATREDLAARTHLAGRRVKLELSGLADLGLAEREGTIWQLSEQGAEILADVGAADDAVGDAVRASPAAVALLSGPATDREVADRTELTRRQARLQLSGLADLDVAVRDDDGRWRLTGHGAQLLTPEGG